MALSATTLEGELSKFMDAESGSFEGYPESVDDFIEKFSEAIRVYMDGCAMSTSSFPLSKSALKSSLTSSGLLEPSVGAGFTALETGLTAFTTAAAPEILAAPVGPIVSVTPPPSPVVLSSIVAIGLAGTSSEVIITMASLIHTNLKTGTFTTSGGSTFPWQ